MYPIKLQVSSGNICRTVSSFQGGKNALEYKVWDVKGASVTRAKRTKGSWFMNDGGCCRFGRKGLEELLIGGGGGGSVSHGEYESDGENG